MKVTFQINNKNYTSDLSNAFDISIPLIFKGPQPNTYDVETATARTYEAGEFIGDTRRGGGCNFEEYRLIPHCNGTHTECVGHISLERISVSNTLKSSFIPSTLLTVTPEAAANTEDVYIPAKNTEDLIITKKCLKDKIDTTDKNFHNALIIRTLPNDDTKRSRRYMENFPPFFSVDAMKYIAELGTEHLLIDIPSVDRTFDEGKLTAHHIFWNVREGSHDVDKHIHSMKTITEMIYAADEITDGCYIANIQIPNFDSDAAPSRVLIYKIEAHL